MLDTLDRVIKYYDDTDTSVPTKERKIEVLEMKSRLLKEMGRNDEMRTILQQILTIGESIIDPSSKTKKTLSYAASILGDKDPIP